MLARLYGACAPQFVIAGVLRHLLDHVALPPLDAALANLCFGRHHVYATQPAAPTKARQGVQVRLGSIEDLDTITRLAQVEIEHRASPPIYLAPDQRSLDDIAATHRALLGRGGAHLIAALDGRDVGLLTIDLTSPAPRLCSDGQPYIGATATARTRGGGALAGPSSPWRSPGPTRAATAGSRSTSSPPTHSPDRSGLAPDSGRSATACSAPSILRTTICVELLRACDFGGYAAHVCIVMRGLRMQVYLETERSLLRRFTEDDAGALFDLDSDPEVMRFLSGGPATPREVIEGEILPRFIGYAERFPGFGLGCDREGRRRFPGWFSLVPTNGPHRRGRTGLPDAPAAWGKGYATEGSRR